jgi:cellulose synthase/poly-beta-1,6-N-acetylglucosamine synthase-like glycosyltransferase
MNLTTRPRRGAPWLVMGLVGALSVSITLWGADTTTGAIALGLQAMFIAFFLRHLAFAVSAMNTAAVDAAMEPVDTGFEPRVTVLVACKNEGVVVDALVDSLLALDYPTDRIQCIVVDDGSDDATPDRLALRAATDPRLEWLRRAPGQGGGKSGALNEGLLRATGEVIVVFDADHQPHADVVRRLVRHFQDPLVAAVQGRCVIRNQNDSPLARLIAIDYLAGYLVNEYGRQSLFRLPAYGGANCAVRASALREAGGWSPHTVTEDTDLTLRLVLAGHRVRYDVSAIDEEEGVVSLARFWKQRYRWARGHHQAWRDYRGAVWRSRRLSVPEKIESTMFLLVFHLPVASAVGLAILLLWVAGLVDPVTPVNVFVLWTLLFLGPLLELGGALLIRQTQRAQALTLVYFLPIFFVSIALCTKAWVDSVCGRDYAWAKTKRSAEPMEIAA